jgi:DNA-binding MarR family transcriptional regulator
MVTEKAAARRSLSLIHGAISEVLGLQKGKKSDLSPIGMSILYGAYTKKIHISDISKMFDIKKSTASGYVDNLESKGYVRRIKDERDGRSTYIEPTEKGKKWILANEKKLSVYIEERMRNLAPAEQEQFIMLLAKFVE